jgi:hypothetical protein
MIKGRFERVNRSPGSLYRALLKSESLLPTLSVLFPCVFMHGAIAVESS